MTKKEGEYNFTISEKGYQKKFGQFANTDKTDKNNLIKIELIQLPKV